ncbi:hypothetical protein [Amycolatopsis suaedae]|uniref:Uncharacterized protein n=1 Tax=Amycolatopsis suaedae TaxID=2510978 RepID=A0A4V2EML9_9PSEU|nr:hypothetical protein [Amycolatopsis suaedae]RZQ65565.1 hypothetical protein EWH70_00225 [Amycolatopsis suaedae]
MFGPHRRALAFTAILSCTAALVASVLVPAAAAQTIGEPAPTAVRVKDAALSDIRASVVPEGGIKAAMTGGNTIYADVREPEPRDDGYRHIDTPRLVSKLREHGLNTYVYGIWDSPTDWDDLRLEFAPAAAAAGIKIWVYTVPPSECFDNPAPHLSGRCSRPFKLDFVRWAQEIATLSLQYPNVVAWAIDDFLIGANGELFTPDYMQQIVDAQDAINPRLGFYTCAYHGHAVSPEFYARFGPYIDGIVYPYLGFSNNTQDPTAVEANLEQILAQTEPRGLGVLFLLYTNRFLDAALPPTENYVAESIRRALPYQRSGRILGIDAYGLPLGGKPAPTADNRAAHGIGRFNVSLASFVGTRTGDYASAEQRIVVNPHERRHTLRFADFDWYNPTTPAPGFHTKQVLVDGKVVWESDVADPGGHGYVERTVDLSDALRGKHTALLTLRVFERNGVGNFPLDVGFDDVRGEGFLVLDGGFEQSWAWKIGGNSRALLGSLDHYAADRPARIRDAVATTLRGKPWTNRPYPPDPAPFPRDGYRTDNTAMFGDGRLSLSLPDRTSPAPNSCATASQRVAVDPYSPRYELSFWHYDQYAQTRLFEGQLVKRLTIDGLLVQQRDVTDWWEYTWMNGSSDQGPIDVGDFVRGKKEVTVAFQLCATDTPPVDLGVDVGVDTIESVGLTVRNPGFESGGAWTMSSTDPALTARIERF